MNKEASITKRQLKLIWVLARDLEIDGDKLHKLVETLTDKKSLRALSVKEGKAVIELLIRLGGAVKKKKRLPRELPANVVELVTIDQANYIKFLEEQLAWQDNPERLKGLIKRTVGKDRVKTKEEAIKIIEGLKAFLKRGEGSRGLRKEKGGQETRAGDLTESPRGRGKND
jgi:hypothetical protein